MIERPASEYEKFEERPRHPITGAPADYCWFVGGKREPRWREPFLKNPDPSKCWYSVQEVARMIGRDPQTVRAYLKSGTLPGHRPRTAKGNAPWFINGAELEAWISGQSRVAPMPEAAVVKGT